MKFSTQAGLLQVETYQTFPDGTLKSCMMDAPEAVNTTVGMLVPRWTDSDVRRKYNNSLSFFASGALKSIALHDPTPIPTSQGIISAEHLTFHESGAIHRVFPCNGRISGYWTEQDEKTLATQHTVSWDSQTLTAAIMIFRFYPSGNLKSLTFWPDEKYEVSTPAGQILARIGVSFYENGAIQSIEPAKPVPVQFEDETVLAFDEDALGLCGDSNSLCFAPDGSVSAFVAEGVRTMPMMSLCTDCSTCESRCTR